MNRNSSNPDITARELQNRIQAGEPLPLLDVREPIEFATYNIGGTNVPLSKLATYFQQSDTVKTAELIVICQAGLRSKTAQALLHENGFSNVRNLTGGLLALRKLNS